MIELEKGKTGLGLSLAGNRDRSRMSVFVVGIDPSGAAGRDGRMVVGDELLEVSCIVIISEVISRFSPFFVFYLYYLCIKYMFMLCENLEVTELFFYISCYFIRSMVKSFMATVTRMHPPQSRALHPKSKSSSSGIKTLHNTFHHSIYEYIAMATATAFH